MLAARFVLIVAALTLACGPGGAAAPGSPAAGAGAAPQPSRPGEASAPAPVETPTTIRLGLVSVSWNSQLPIAIAQQEGYFREQGLVVEQQTVPSGGAVLLAMLMSGEIDMTSSGIEAQLAGIAAGAPSVIVGGVLDKVDYAVVGTRGMSGVDSLRGKLIGTTGPGTHSEFSTVESLRRLGLVRDRDYALRMVGSTAIRRAALSTGQIDAGPFSSGDRVGLEAEGYPVLLELGRVIPEFPFSVMAAHRGFAASHPDAIVGFLRAVAKAHDVIRQDKERAVELGKAAGLEGDPALQRRALDLTIDDYQIDVKKEGLAALMAAKEMPGTPEDFYDDRFVKRALTTR